MLDGAVAVPATSANLGPGFDTLGLALDLWLRVRAAPSPEDRFVYRGEGSLPSAPDNLVHQGFRAVYARVGRQAPRVRFEVDNPIPLARGLGSSSAALVAGAALADLSLQHPLGRDGVFALCAGLEGHPDNVAPAVYGGFTVSAQAKEGFVSRAFALPRRWQLLFAVPAFELLTSQARAVLPTRYSREDAVFTSSRSALWVVAALCDQPELLRVAAQDRLHEPYREKLVPGMAECRAALYRAGAQAVFLSGAGPTLGAIVLTEASARCLEPMQAFAGEQGRVLALGSAGGYRFASGSAPRF